ncbi:Cytochrome P450 4F5 [Madurella mycetomatis]|uniref:Cytochrome P450 4F5 n=1 Tax=Madurella mycetomatis TaxID=100816 RepID=A0A175VRI2_9PEZI|nr:Cytochrome P450 4F5 [Madurella mycetomatis]
MDAAYILKGLLRLDMLTAVLGVYLAQLVAYKIYRAFIYPYFVSPLRHLPGPKDHHFLIGHALNQFRSGNPNQPYVSWMRQWPKAPLIRYFDVGNSDAVLVTSLDAHKEILQAKAYSFQKPPFFVRLIANIVGFGLGFAEGEEHRKQRRVLAALFSSSNLKEFIPLLRSKARHLSNQFDGIIETEGGVVELVSVYSKITLDIMGVFALGLELDDIQPSNTSKISFQACYHELFEPDSLGQMLLAINGIIPIRWLPLEANRRFIQATKTIRRQLRDVIRDRIRAVGASKAAGKGSSEEKAKDLLTFMVAEKYYADSDQWTENEIMDQILTFLAAGHQTTADALTWATQLMIEHPAEAQRLRTEVVELLRRNPVPEYRDIEALPYLKNFTREVLRVHCPGVNVAREAIDDVVIQGVTIPKGTTVLMQPAIIQHNPTVWGSDCDEFKPDRWDRLEGEAADPWAFSAFSHGPRICIGRTLSMLEFKIILIELVSTFDFEGIGNTKGSEMKLINPSPMLRPDGGIRVRVKRVKW